MAQWKQQNSEHIHQVVLVEDSVADQSTAVFIAVVAAHDLHEENRYASISKCSECAHRSREYVPEQWVTDLNGNIQRQALQVDFISPKYAHSSFTYCVDPATHG